MRFHSPYRVHIDAGGAIRLVPSSLLGSSPVIRSCIYHRYPTWSAVDVVAIAHLQPHLKLSLEPV
ncbi:MAG: hypothetical protein AAGA75_24220 [Cyanobacteria bacterium P01_E01_bin.6]